MSRENTMREVCSFRDVDAIEGLKIVRYEVWRAFALGIVPDGIDRSDLESVGDEALVMALQRGYTAVRQHIRHELLKFITRTGYKDADNVIGMPQPSMAPGYDLTELDVSMLIAALDGEYQEIIRLHFIDGLSLSEAARALGINKAAAFERLRTAIRRLRKMLGVIPTNADEMDQLV